MPDALFVEIMKRHFDIEEWQTTPIIKQDVWLYKYFVFQYEKGLKDTKLLRKYVITAFIYDDAEFYEEVELINVQSPELPKGVVFIPNDEPEGLPANHKLAENLAPRSVKNE
jgi:hypothetical protein